MSFLPEPCLTMTKARTVGCRVKDLVLNTEIFSTLSTPLMTSGGKPGGSRWRATVRRWGSSPASGGKKAFPIPRICCSPPRGVEGRGDEDVADRSQDVFEWVSQSAQKLSVGTGDTD